MIKEALEWIVDQQKDPERIEIRGRDFTTRPLQAVVPPSAITLEVNSLKAIVDYIESGDFSKEELIIHVVNHKEVKLLTRLNVPYMKRNCLVRASIDEYETTFRFGRKYDREEFIIELMSKFVRDDSTDYSEVLETAGKLMSEKIKSADDDGVSQTVTQKHGALVGKKNLKNPVTLMPHRTFAEIPQPASEFNFRAHQIGDELPQLALYSADGGSWKIDAISRIAEYFRGIEEIKDITILA